ncbi:hypothetical protein E4U53_001143 [Claviceps sorghi]|nr:hypothetical protein E4U53_001143 [Claviceps sorghi]
MESDTSPRPLARGSGHARVDSLLACLSPWELLHLRNEFRKGSINITGLATLLDLPVEILSMIVTQLELEDVVRCRLVSRSWRVMWTHGAVITTMCRYFFPGLLEKAAIDRDPRGPAELLQSCIARNLWHRRGAHSESKAVRRERTSGPAMHVSRTTDLSQASFYQEGFLAWQNDGSSVIVHDLRADQRHLCNFSVSWLEGERQDLKGMSSHLLVFTISTSLKIWHIQSRTWKRLRLPGPFQTCYVDREQVAVLTRQGLIIRWSWNGSATELDQSHSLNMVPEGYGTGIFRPGVILHPQKANITYLVRIYESKSKDTCSRELIFLMSVVRHDAGVPTHRWLENILPASLGDADDLSSPPLNSFLTLPCSKMSAHGLYSIGIVETNYSVHEFATTAFNIYKEAFVQRRFQYAKPDHSHGNPRMLRMRHSTGSWAGQKTRAGYLTAWSEANPMIPRYVASPSSEDNNTDTLHPAAQQFCIFGDDEFHVSVSNNGYMVWLFAMRLSAGNELDCEDESQTSWTTNSKPIDWS